MARAGAETAIDGDRTILGSISKRGNRYLRSLFVQAAWVVLVKIGPKHWDRYGLKSWIEAARKRLHHNVPAIALANKLARIAWAVLHMGRIFECVKTNEAASRPAWRRPDKPSRCRLHWLVGYAPSPSAFGWRRCPYLTYTPLQPLLPTFPRPASAEFMVSVA
jgi:hypothetical protein